MVYWLLLNYSSQGLIFSDLNVKLELFAYDIKLYSTYDLHGSKSDLAAAVNCLYDWSRTWQLQMKNVLFSISQLEIKTLIIMFMVLAIMYLLV